ncbi:unnamed protein product [Strongylus vulgaris]|uniref:Myosin tail domain-containing protein n=1 Tax=Strongylus vulgaris TaxID=40348 RepID=A0A3P7JF03_STRVU|nr:unnamed protein product [Strongylus vulgaris]
MTIAEFTEAGEEANRNRSNLMGKLRKTEDELAELLESQEDLKQAAEKAEKEVLSLKSQLADARKRFDEELEQHIADLQRKATRELAEAVAKAEEADRKFDQQLAEEKANTSKAISERDAAQQQARDAETRYLNVVKESKELHDQLEVIDKERRMLRLEVDNLASTKDDAGKSVFELEKAKKRLEEELAEAREQIIELEDALQLADDAKTRGEVMLQAAKQDWERQLSQRSEEEDDQRRSLTKRLRDLEEELNVEQRSRAQAVQAKKKVEAQV